MFRCSSVRFNSQLPLGRPIARVEVPGKMLSNSVTLFSSGGLSSRLNMSKLVFTMKIILDRYTAQNVQYTHGQSLRIILLYPDSPYLFYRGIVPLATLPGIQSTGIESNLRTKKNSVLVRLISSRGSLGSVESFQLTSLVSYYS